MSHSPSSLIHSLFETAQDFMGAIKSDGVLDLVNPVWCSQLGWNLPELTESIFLDFIQFDDRHKMAQALEKLINGQTVNDLEIRLMSKTGLSCWTQWNISPLSPNLFLMIGRNIERRKKEQEKTQKAIQLLQQAEQTAKIGHWQLDVGTGLMSWSNEMFKIYGQYPNKAAITLDDFIDVFNAAGQNKLWQLIETTVQTGEKFEIELSLNDQNGEEHIVVIRAQCEQDENKCIKGLFGTIQDLTQERLHNKRLREKEDLLSIAFKATSDGIWDWDLLTDQVWYSPQWKAMLGYDDDELPNTFDSWTNLIFEQDRIKAMDELHRHTMGETDRFEMVQRLRHKNGQTIHILVRAFAVRDERGRAVRLVGAHTNISDLKRLEQAKSEFTSIVSHELRTPLTALHGALGLLKGLHRDSLSQDIQRLLDIACNNSERLTLLINDILDIEKLQSGKMDFDIHPLDVREILTRSIDNHIGYAGKFNVNLDLQFPDDTKMMIEADHNRLQQVISNLLSNAIKFSPAEGTVVMRAQTTGQKIQISVEDHGPGIPKDMLSKIFDKFVQVDSSDNRAVGGTGLGLSIAQALTRHMNGRIFATSTIGKGATFNLVFNRYVEYGS